MTIQTNISEEKMKVYQEVKRILDENRVRSILEECGVAYFFSNQMVSGIVDAFYATYVPNKSEFWQTIEVIKEFLRNYGEWEQIRDVYCDVCNYSIDKADEFRQQIA